MTKPIRTEPEADEELLEATRWYEQRRPGLGLEFLGAIGAAVEDRRWLRDDTDVGDRADGRARCRACYGRGSAAGLP